MKRFTLIAALFAALLSLPAKAERESLAIGVSQYPTTFNPLLEASVAQSYVHGMTMRPLTYYDAEWQLVCGVCETVPTFENGLAVREPLADGSGEGAAVTYRLRKDLFWGDGTPVTAEDFRFTWEVGKNPAVGAIGGEAFRRILAVDVVDDHTVTFHLDRVTFTYNASGLTPLPAHVEKPIYEADPAGYRARTAFDSDAGNPGLAFGPYRIAEARSGSEVRLVRNAHWQGEVPAFEEIRVVTIGNTAALEANLLSGSIDMISGELGLNTDQGLAFQRRHGGDYRILFKAGLIYEHVDIDVTRPIVEDVRVRQALLYGIDRAQLVERLFAGKQPVALSNVSPLSAAFTEDVPRYPFDPERAAALLDEAGWTLQGGERRNAEGAPLLLSITTTAGDRTRELVQQVLQSQWKQLGIAVRIQNKPPRVLFGGSLRERDYGDMALFAWIAAPGSVPRTTLHSDDIPSPENGFSGQNYTGYSNPLMDDLIDRIERTLDEPARNQLWHELQRLYMTDLPVLPLYWRAQTFVLPPWLEGVTPTGNLTPTTIRIEDWRVSE